ncbi:rep protein [Geminiviridae sp.]|nr:rep protein [Geminiviridae sp.]
MDQRQDRPYPLEIMYKYETGASTLLFKLHPRKCRHVYLWTKQPNYGKTTLLKWLDDRYRCSWYNVRE